MSSKLKEFVQRWLVNTAAVLVATYMVSGITYKRPVDLFIASLLLGILNAFVRPLIKFLSWPLILLTLGLFSLVINAVLLYFVSWMMQPGFSVADFKAAFWGALVITIVSIFLNLITGTGKTRIQVRRGPPPPSRHDGDGPVIDV
jgi:putative membrane protein